MDQSHITGASDEIAARPVTSSSPGLESPRVEVQALSVAVGETSSCGEIAEMIGVGGEDATPLQRRLQKLAFDIGSASRGGGVRRDDFSVENDRGRRRWDDFGGRRPRWGSRRRHRRRYDIVVRAGGSFLYAARFFFVFFSKSFVRFQNDDGRSVMIGVLRISQRERNSLTRQTRVFADFLRRTPPGLFIAARRRPSSR